MARAIQDERLLACNATIEIGTTINDLGSDFIFDIDAKEAVMTAVVLLAPTEDSQYHYCVYDRRPESIRMAEDICGIRDMRQMMNSSVNAKNSPFFNVKLIDQAEKEAIAEWSEIFNRPAAVFAVIDKGGHAALMLREPKSTGTPNALFTAIKLTTGPQLGGFATRESRGSWLRKVRVSDKNQEDVNHFLVITVSFEDSPVMLTLRTVNGDILEETDYTWKGPLSTVVYRKARILEETWLKGGPEKQPESENLQIDMQPVNEPEPDEIGEITNGEIDEINRVEVDSSKEDADALINLPIQVANLDIGSGEAEKLKKHGFKTLGQLAAASVDGVKKALGCSYKHAGDIISAAENLVAVN